jgi:hypothetical protein
MPVAQSFRTNLLLDVRNYREGRVPDQLLAARVQAKPRRNDD